MLDRPEALFETLTEHFGLLGVRPVSQFVWTDPRSEAPGGRS
jgi:hypothetical protein